MTNAIYSFLVTAIGILAGLFVVFLFFQFISFFAGLDNETENIRQDEEIHAICDQFRFERIGILESMGPPCDNGKYDAGQMAKWERVRELERQEKEFLSYTEVVNLEPLGDRTGRVYKK